MKAISFSLWGSQKKYTVGAIRNADLAMELYQDWYCLFYIATQSVPKNIIDELYKYPNTIFVLKQDTGDWRSMFWRFESSYDPRFDISIFRDTDSRLSLRERYAVDEWLDSNKTFHIMRDHPHHGFPILGGMWGLKKNNKYPIEQLLNAFDKQNKYGTDYEFFIRSLYPLIENDKVVHDPFFEKKPFPTNRNGLEFVGQVYDENDQINTDHTNALKNSLNNT